MIGDPLLVTGAVQERLTTLSPAFATTPVGGVGAAMTMTALEIAEAGPAPSGFFAATRKTYVLPVLNPLITIPAAGEGVWG